jgi:hypothetical protein
MSQSTGLPVYRAVSAQQTNRYQTNNKGNVAALLISASNLMKEELVVILSYSSAVHSANLPVIHLYI